jgi:hypothetical protein
MSPSSIRTMTVTLVCALGGILTAPALTLAASPAPCTSAVPDSIIPCLERIYATRDFDAYRQILAPDFQYRFKDTGWGLPDELASAEKMFRSDSIEAMSLTFGPEYKLAEGPEPHTWVFSGLSLTLAVDQKERGSVRHHEIVDHAGEICVRLETEPAPHIVIYRWVGTGE